MRWAVLPILLALASCDDELTALADAGRDASAADRGVRVRIDIGFIDFEDSGIDDGFRGDPDAGLGLDATTPLDLGVGVDAGAVDAGAPDVGAPDATADAGSPDAGARDAGAVDAGAPDTGAPDAGRPVADGPTGFIGSPCQSDADCPYADGACLLGGFLRGTCSAPCDRFCPDLAGHPVTFCAAASDLPPEGQLGDGSCLSRCDFGAFPGTGCRPDYGCRTVGRANEPATRQQICAPGPGDEISTCQEELAALGVDFEPTTIADRSPSTHPNLTCHVEDPVVLHPPILGVDVRYYDGSATPNLRAACAMAKALVKTIQDVKPLGVTTLLHIGTYNCRVISGTNTLSRHAYGDAIDIYGFEFADGSRATLVDDWEHNTTMPSSPEGLFLYESAHRWNAAEIWNIILTPNYNAAHDNHFHVDLTPGSDYLRLLGQGPYLGPNLYAD